MGYSTESIRMQHNQLLEFDGFGVVRVNGIVVLTVLMHKLKHNKETCKSLVAQEMKLIPYDIPVLRLKVTTRMH